MVGLKQVPRDNSVTINPDRSVNAATFARVYETADCRFDAIELANESPAARRFRRQARELNESWSVSARRTLA